MFKAAFSPFSGGSGGNNANYNPNMPIPTSIADIAKAIQEKSTGSFEASADSVDMSNLPVTDGMQANVPMMPPTNSAANIPVFSPATQEKAASVYGTDNERQGAVSGFKQKAKDRIISELNNL